LGTLLFRKKSAEGMALQGVSDRRGIKDVVAIAFFGSAGFGVRLDA
jgi:hypothetical protein